LFSQILTSADRFFIPLTFAGAILHYSPAPVIVEVSKYVSCYETGPWTQHHADSFVGTWVYFKIIVKNPTSGAGAVPIEHCYLQDDLTGEWTDLQFISGFNLSPGVVKDVGPIPPNSQVESLFKVKTKAVNPNTAIDITNLVTVAADGPDPDTDPDVTDADTTIINTLMADIQTEHLVKIVDNIGTVYDFAHVLQPYANISYPITITWKSTFQNLSDAGITPHVKGYNKLLEKLPGLLTTPPGGTLPPWDMPNMPVGVPMINEVTQIVKSMGELVILDMADNDSGFADHRIESIAFFADPLDPEVKLLLDDPSICGEAELYDEDQTLIFQPDVIKIPTLSEWGMIIMALLLGGAIVIRMRQTN